MSAARSSWLGFAADTGAGVWTLWSAACGLKTAFSIALPFGERRLARALSYYLWRPLPLILLLACLIGVSAGVLGAAMLSKIHAELAILPAIANLLAGQVAPLIVGIFAAGRVSVALVAKLAVMRFEGEIDALVLQGHDPLPFIYGPVLASLLAAAPVLSVTAAAAAIVGAGLVFQLSELTPLSRFVGLVTTPDLGGHALKGVVRSYAYLLLALAGSGVVGTAPMSSLAELDRRVAQAFTLGLVLIFTASALLSLWS